MKCNFCQELIESDCKYCTQCGKSLTMGTSQKDSNQLSNLAKNNTIPGAGFAHSNQPKGKISSETEHQNRSIQDLNREKAPILKKLEDYNKKLGDYLYRIELTKKQGKTSEVESLLGEATALKSMIDDESLKIKALDEIIESKKRDLNIIELAHDANRKKYYFIGGAFGFALLAIPFLPYSAPTVSFTLAAVCAVAGIVFGKLSEREGDEASKYRMMQAGLSYEYADQSIKKVRSEIKENERRAAAEKRQKEQDMNTLAKKISDEMKK